MRVFLAHNHYLQRGGEDAVFKAEAQLLRDFGCEVVEYSVSNSALNRAKPFGLAANALWSHSSYAAINGLIKHLRPDVMHVHNTLARLSPSVYYAARRQGVPVVQSLHNYRMLCANGLLFRDGRPCHACSGKVVAWPAVVHGCYRDRAASAAVAATNAMHKCIGTWQRQVHRYVAPTEFVKDRFIAAGWPADRIAVKGHFVPDPGCGRGHGGYALYVGRLDAAKGIRTVLAAWHKGIPVPLKIIGDGPLSGEVAAAAQRNPAVQWLGPQPPQEVAQAMAAAACLIVPSISYETGCRVIVEALACGTPILAAETGAAGEMVRPGISGLHFRPGDARGLAARVARLATAPVLCQRLRQGARAEYERRYTPQENYRQLIAIYHQAMEQVAGTANCHKQGVQ